MFEIKSIINNKN